MPNSILNFFSSTNGSFLHAKGRVASVRLMELLDCRPGESVLELGCGTGATLTHLAALHPQTALYGYDVSEAMLAATRRRLRFCLLEKRVQLQLIQSAESLPAPTGSFDKVFVESVLGIQEDDTLRKLLTELHRLLKKDGMLLFNETIWLEETTREEAVRINEKCLSAFGIIQSNSKYLHLGDWQQLLSETGFHIDLVEVAGEVATTNQLSFSFKGKFLSEVFNMFGKLKSILNTRLRNEWRKYNHEMARLLPPGKKMMEGYIVRAFKKDTDFN